MKKRKFQNSQKFIVNKEDNAPLPSFIAQPTPIISKEFLDILREAGIENIDTYPAELLYDDGSLVPGDYFVLNVLGLVSIEDLNDSLDLPIFRLKESPAEIIVCEDVKNAIEGSGMKYVELYNIKDSGLF